MHLVEQAAQLRIVRDRLLQVGLRAGGCDRENLAREVLAAPCVEKAVRLEVGAVTGDLLPQLGTPSPVTASVRTIGGFQSLSMSRARIERTSFSIVFGRMVLLTTITSGISMIPAFSAWTARARHEHEHDRVRHADHLDLALASTDRLEEHEVAARRVKHEERLKSPRRGRRGGRASPSSG